MASSSSLRSNQVMGSNLADQVEDDVLDLSLKQLVKVPVSEIALIPKATILDLSNNLLTSLPDDFPNLTHLVKLDLSKNQLEELPEYFGNLRNLKHLDLYSNKLTKLPLSFSNLRNLRWLDLKNNPLVPALQQAAGPCITAQDCSSCAKKVTALLQGLQDKMEKERELLMIRQQKAEERKQQERQEARERIKSQKKAAKKERSRMLDHDHNHQVNNGKHSSSDGHAGAAAAAKGGSVASMAAASTGGGSYWNRRSYSSKESLGTKLNSNKSRTTSKGSEEKKSGGGCFRKLALFLFSLLMMAAAIGVSLVWIYTGGNMDQASVEKALPLLARDLNAGVATSSKMAEEYVGRHLAWLREELERRYDLVAHYVNRQLNSPEVCTFIKRAKAQWAQAEDYAKHFWSFTAKPALQVGVDNVWKALEVAIEFSQTRLEILWKRVDSLMNKNPQD